MPLTVLSIAQMRDWEKATWAGGQTEAEVIRQVGKHLASTVLRLTKPQDLILILAGKGNNGADARAARELLTERRVDLLDIKDPSEDLSRLEALLSLAPALIVDGLFGIGINRPLSDDWIKFIRRVNQASAPVLAVDLPSGLNADTGQPQGAAIQAALTLTVGAVKTGLLNSVAWPYVGRLEVGDEVGLLPCPFSGDLQWTLPTDFNGFPPPRPASTHKGSYGHLAILAGSLGYHGASVLAARGAQRAQPGLITLHTMENVYPCIAAQLEAVMVTPWQPATELDGPYTAALIGPGLAAKNLPAEIKSLTQRLWREAPMPIIIDASALDWLAQQSGPPNTVRVVTPHPGEAARMLGSTVTNVQENRPAALRDISRRLGDCWVILKGHQTLIGRSSGPVFINSSGNPHLAQGGSGDLLSGFVAGLLAQPGLQNDVLRALRFAVWEHGAAADLLQERQKNWTVEDLSAVLGQ